ncbi:hypothetical protein [Pigmentiphaga aceris]|uniref:hypothetical protein n=1 Tax=Pigmentiphaga aceris TaxID=1940612 RepID=UPI0016525690|nr:hypothetical protein [Pigmentiphaga aceris]
MHPNMHPTSQFTSQATTSLTTRLALVAAGALMSMSAFAADTSATSTAQSERARCESGQSNQDRATCLKEVGAAQGEAKAGNLTGAGAFDQNATDRCKALPASDQAACMGRLNSGTSSGSAESGGIIREYRQTEVGTPSAPGTGNTPTTAVPVAPSK